MPGYWCIRLLNFAVPVKINEKSQSIISIVISYILLTMVSLLRLLPYIALPNTAIFNSALSIIIGSFMVIVISIIAQRRWFRKIMVRLFHKTINDDIWRDVLDLESGSNLKVYLKDKDYYIIGHHKNHEENGTDSWLALSGFAKFDKESNKPYKTEPNHIGDTSAIVTLRFSSIDYIEIF